MAIGHNKNCRLCGSDNLFPYLDFGNQPPSDGFLTKEQLQESITYYPLKAVLCIGCGHHQIDFTVDPKVLYQQDYPYESSTTETGKKHYFSFAEKVFNRFNLDKNSKVLDIGSNVGVLLEGFKKQGAKVKGIDPAYEIVKKANNRGIDTIFGFFDKYAAEALLFAGNQFDVITGTNVFAHIDNLHDFMRGITTILKTNGVFIFESPSFLSLFNNNAYSSYYHEHISYLTIAPLITFLDLFGLEIFDIEKQSIHEGSIRTFIGYKGKHKVEESVNNLLEEELKAGVYNKEIIKKFGERCKEHAIELERLVSDLTRLNPINNNKVSIVALSMPAKGQTLIEYAGLSNHLLFGTEKSPLKIGKYSPNGKVKVVDDKELLNFTGTRYAILLAWNFAEEIMRNNEEFKQMGGKFIVPFPYIRVV